MGTIESVEGNLPEALDLLSRAISLEPSVIGYIRRASVYRRQEQFDLAQADLDEAFRLDPTNPDAFYQQGLLSYFVDDYQRAVEAFTENLKVYVNDPLAHYWRGLSYFDLQQYEQALADFNISVEGCATECHLDYFMRAETLMALERFDEAKRDYETALSLEPNMGRAFMGLGVIDALQGRLRSAGDNINRALQLLQGSVDRFDLQTRTSANGRIDPFDNQDEFSIALNRGDEIAVRLDIPEDSVFRPVILVRDSSGNPLAFSEVRENGTLEPRVRRVLAPVSGTYAIVVASYNGLSTGIYTLVIERR